VDGLKYIFAQPEFIDGVGNVYPIQLRNYNEFQSCSKILYVSKNHFSNIDIPLLTLIFISAEYLGFTNKELADVFKRLFSLVLRESVKIRTNNNLLWYEVGNNGKIDAINYDIVRSIIMRQNLLFEQKVYKNPKVQEWANKALEARVKNAPKISIEDMVTTVSVYKGVGYKELMDYTLYQLYADLYRIKKIKRYDADVIFRSVSDKITIEDFAEQIDLFRNPYEDLFVDKNKLSKLNKVFKK